MGALHTCMHCMGALHTAPIAPIAQVEALRRPEQGSPRHSRPAFGTQVRPALQDPCGQSMLYVRCSMHDAQCTVYNAHAALELDNGQPVPYRFPTRANRGVPRGQRRDDRR